MRGSKLYTMGLLAVLIVAVAFMLTVSGCSKKDDIVPPKVVEPVHTTDNGTIKETPPTPATPVVPPAPICGDNKLDANEQCDGSVPTGMTCQSNGYDGGTISCKKDCTLDLSACTKLISCTDTDGGLNYTVKGTITLNDNGSITTHIDYCRDASGTFKGYVYEYYCANDTVASDNHKCPRGCSDGRCV